MLVDTNPDEKARLKAETMQRVAEASKRQAKRSEGINLLLNSREKRQQYVLAAQKKFDLSQPEGLDAFKEFLQKKYGFTNGTKLFDLIASEHIP